MMSGKIKIFSLFLAVLCVVNAIAAQEPSKESYGKISKMIADSRKANGMFTELLGGKMPATDNTESTVLSAINLPNSVKVKFTGKIRKISDKRKDIVKKWLKDYAEMPDARYYYVNEVEVEEDGVKYWVMAHENLVVTLLKNLPKKSRETVLEMKILGYTTKGKAVEYYLLADSVKQKFSDG